MGRNSRVCVVCGVQERHRGGFFASFPHDVDRCKTWLKVIGNEDLVHIPIEKLVQMRFVCGDHFIKQDFTKKGNRLKKRAMPKLNLLAPLVDAQLADFPQHIASAGTKVDVNLDQPSKQSSIHSWRSSPSDATKNIPATKSQKAEKEVSENTTQVLFKNPEDEMEIPTINVFDLEDDIDMIDKEEDLSQMKDQSLVFVKFV